VNEKLYQERALRVSPSVLLLGLFAAIGVLLGVTFLARATVFVWFLAPSVALLTLGSVALLLRIRYASHYLLALLMVSVTFQGNNFGIRLKPDAMIVPLLGLVLLLHSPGRYLCLRSYPFFIPAIGFLAANFAAAALHSPVPETSLAQSTIFVGRVATFFLVVMAIHHMPELRGRLPIYFIILLIGHTLASIIAVLLYPIMPTPLVLYNQDGRGSLSVNGFFLEPNLYGIFVLCVLGIMIGIGLYAPAHQLRLLGAAGLIGLIGLLLGYTRSTWLGLGLLIAVLAMIVATRGTRRAFARYSVITTLLAAGAIGLLALLMLLSIAGYEIGLLNRFLQIFDVGSDSAAVRTIVWGLAIDAWRKHPWIGNGPLSFPYTSGWIFSSMLQSLHDSGIIGLICMLWICLGTMAYTWYGYFRATEPQDRGILLGYLLALIGLFFTSQFSSFFWGGFSWVMFGLAVGHAGVVIRKWKQNQHAGIDAATTV